MRYFFTIFIISMFGFSNASNISVSDDFDFKLALDFATNNNIDTLILTTSGGIYTTTDTTRDYLVIETPLVIIAVPDLEFPPIFTHSSIDSSALEIFRVMDDITFEGVVFDGGHEQSHGMKYAIRVGDGVDENDNPIVAKVGLNITINNCYFKDFYDDKDLANDGHAFYFLKGVDAGNVKITNSTFENMGYEAIRISETEKYAIDRCLDTLVVQNCTFINIDNESVRFYHDQDAATDDAYVLLENITVYNSAVRAFFVKSIAGIEEGHPGATILRNVIVANARLDGTIGNGRSDYVAQIQGTTAYVSNIDTFMMVFNPAIKRENTVEATKGGSVDTTTVYGFDPQFVDPDNGDFTLTEGSPVYTLGHDGKALGDLRWAKYPPAVGITHDKPVHEFTLKQNYPNPFNPLTTIEYTLPGISPVKITIHDITGKVVKELFNGMVTAGSHSVNWDASGYASGIYIYKIEAGIYSKTRKMMLLK